MSERLVVADDVHQLVEDLARGLLVVVGDEAIGQRELERPPELRLVANPDQRAEELDRSREVAPESAVELREQEGGVVVEVELPLLRVVAPGLVDDLLVVGDRRVLVAVFVVSETAVEVHLGLFRIQRPRP